MLKWGCHAKVNNDRSTRFWEGIWVGNTPLRLGRDCLICDCWEGDGWNINFRRALGEADMREWEILMNILEEYRLNGGMISLFGYWISQETILQDPCTED